MKVLRAITLLSMPAVINSTWPISTKLGNNLALAARRSPSYSADNTTQRMPRANKAMSKPPRPAQRSITSTKPEHGDAHGSCGKSEVPHPCQRSHHEEPVANLLVEALLR